MKRHMPFLRNSVDRAHLAFVVPSVAHHTLCTHVHAIRTLPSFVPSSSGVGGDGILRILIYLGRRGERCLSRRIFCV